MKQVSLEELVQKAMQFSKNSERWHYHFLTRNCMYNVAARQFQIILENEEDGGAYVAVSYEKPLAVLKQMEELKK